MSRAADLGRAMIAAGQGRAPATTMTSSLSPGYFILNVPSGVFSRCAMWQPAH